MKYQLFQGKGIVKAGIIGIAIIALGVVGFWQMNQRQMDQAKTTIIPKIVEKLDPSVTVKDVVNIRSESGIYVFDLKLDVQGAEQTFTSYMTKDGKVFFTGGITVADLEKQADVAGVQSEKPSATCEDLAKTDKPMLAAYIVADCPYGLQMQRVMKMAIEEEGQLAAYMTVKYIGSVQDGKITSMHGDKEAQENLRQICIREEQQTLYWPYVSCYMKEGKSGECLKQTGVDQTKVQTCMSDAQKGLAYAKKDFDSANQYKISGSPTLVIQDRVVSEFDFGGRNAESMKQLICCSAKEKFAFCSKTLTKDQAAASYATEDTGQVAGAAAENCATE